MEAGTTRGSAALEKGLVLFLRVIEGGETSLAILAKDAGIPRSTAQRLVGAFVRTGLLSRTGRGLYAPGLRLAGMAAAPDRKAILAGASRMTLRRLAHEFGATVHLGVLEGDMVTYLVKEHGGGGHVLTSERSQFEAYCSGIGKVLLATLDEAALEAYLDAGPLIALTPATITDAAVLRAELKAVRDRGYATDDAELQPGLFCVAVPVLAPDGQVLAAISASRFAPWPREASHLARLRDGAARIGRRLAGRS